MNRTKNVLCAALLPAMVLVTGCSPEGGPSTTPAEPPAPAASSAGPTTPSSTPSDSTSLPNDLKKSPLRRTYQSAGLTVTVEYSAIPSVDKWTATSPKSVRLFMTVVNKNKPSRKIYLSRASVRFGVLDANGQVPAPDPILDSSGLNPGYLVTSPYSYNQSFAIPELDDSAIALTLDFKFETVTLVDKKAKDYTKQASTDTVQVTLKV
jgi:hypothetical protein